MCTHLYIILYKTNDKLMKKLCIADLARRMINDHDHDQHIYAY